MEDHEALTHLATVLAAAFLGGAVFQRLRQPVLVGYIVVGLILGPSMLGVVSERGDIALLAELGILLLLFIAGMDVDLMNFRAVAKISLKTCAAQIGIGLLAMSALGLIFQWPFNRCVLLGFSISLSSTAVALKIIDDMGLRQTRVGQTSVGILIAQDLAVVPMILIIGALNTEAGFNYFGLVRLAVAVAILCGLVFLLTRKPRTFMRLWVKFDRAFGASMRGQSAITSLAFCFSAAAIAGLAGLSAAYGAFIAGMVLGHTVKRDQLHSNTKPIFDVMIMVFFLSIGLLIDLQFLRENIVTTLSLLIITMLLKTVVNVHLLRWQGMEDKEAFVTGAVLAQIGEFSFILAAMGLSAATIDEAGYKFVVAIISLSLLATPLWLYLVRHHDFLQKLQFPLPGMGRPGGEK